MKIVGGKQVRQRNIGERNYYKCSECGAEYTDMADANACQAKHFDERQKKRKMELSSLAALDAPSIMTKPKISVGKTASSLPPEDDDNIPVLTAQPNHDAGVEVNDEDDLQKLADRLMEQYK